MGENPSWTGLGFMGVFATNLLRNLLQFFPSFDCTPRKWDKLLSHSAAMLFSIGEEFRSAACKVLKVKIASYKDTLSFTPVDIGGLPGLQWWRPGLASTNPSPFDLE